MSDEELLNAAERSYLANNEITDPAEHQANSLRSIAASLMVIARNSMPITVNQSVEQAEPGFRQAAIDSEVRRRIAEYQKYWNPETGMFEIDKGTENEWICTEDELYADVRKSVEFEL